MMHKDYLTKEKIVDLFFDRLANSRAEAVMFVTRMLYLVCGNDRDEVIRSLLESSRVFQPAKEAVAGIVRNVLDGPKPYNEQMAIEQLMVLYRKMQKGNA